MLPDHRAPPGNLRIAGAKNTRGIALSCSVSVIIPVYNSAATLPRAVESARRQTLTDIELIIVNDGSTDGTEAMARELARADGRIRVLSMPQNQGKPAAMNTAIAEAQADWVAVLDADDWYAPDRLSMLRAAGEREAVDLIADNQFLYDDGADRVVRAAFPSSDGDRMLDVRSFTAGSDPYADFDFGMLKPMVRTSFIRRTGLRYRETAKLSEDFLYLVEFFAANGRAFLLAEPHYYWRQAFGSISRRWTETGNGSWRYNFLSAAAANNDVLRALRQKNQPELSRLLERRVKAFLRLHLLQELNRMRASGAAPLYLAREVLSHPSIWKLVAQRYLRRVKRRLPDAELQRA